MVLQESIFEKAQEQAQEAAEKAVGRAETIASVPGRAGDCLGEAVETANELKGDLTGLRGRLEPAKTNLVGMLRSQVTSLADQATAAASEFSDAPGSTFSEMGKQLALDALSEGVSKVRRAGRRRIQEELGRTSSKAVFGAMDVIMNRKDSFYRGIMGILIHRELRDLRKLEASARRLRRKASLIARAVQIVKAVNDARDVETGPTDQALRQLEVACRQLRIAQSTYQQQKRVPTLPTGAAARALREASETLASNPVAEDIMKGLERINIQSAEAAKKSANREIDSRKRRAERAIGVIERARDAILDIPGNVKEMAQLYGKCVTWARLAQALPDTLESVNSAAKLIKAGERLRYLIHETEALKTKVEDLSPDDGIDRRAQLAKDAQMIALSVEALKELTTDPNRRTRDWYENAVSLFESPFLQGNALAPLKDVELQAELLSGEKGLESKGSVAQSILNATSSLTRTIGSLRARAERAARRNSRGNGAVDLVGELLRRAGIENPIDTIINGELPTAIKTIVSGGALVLPDELPAELPEVSDLEAGDVKDIVSEGILGDQAEVPCKDAGEYIPVDEESARVAAMDKVREKKRVLSGPIQAMKASDEQMKTDIMRYAL